MSEGSAANNGPSLGVMIGLIVGVMVVAQVIIQGLVTLRMKKLKVSYEEVKEDAQLSNALLVGTNVATCYHCYRLEMNTWGDAKVKAALAEHSVKLIRAKPSCVNVYCTKNNIKQGRGIPFTVLIGKDGKCLGTVEGYREPRVMLGIIKKYFPLSDEVTVN